MIPSFFMLRSFGWPIPQDVLLNKKYAGFLFSTDYVIIFNSTTII